MSKLESLPFLPLAKPFPLNAKLRILGSRLVPALIGIGLGVLAIAIRAFMK
ncbi:hypothetical protein [Roseofilum sp. Guam]|uniref:hypothetical protein n=1 Tax=Roseofilum sp. Guam TaxID=2821502 RepID=UPI001B208146|nr:hypothetical protein [Roseofilum sp. Guam]MBP0031396.1 hypothetical protein [Roseofilum sp. Guam]